jgi:hypothetical protein
MRGRLPDRYVNTSDNLPDFNKLVENLEVLKLEIIKDQNQNELPIPQKRAVIAELEGLVAQIKGGYVKSRTSQAGRGQC